MEMAGCRRPNNRFVPWQRSSPIGNPLLFVIPSEADLSRLAVEGSAVPWASPGNVDFHAQGFSPPDPSNRRLPAMKPGNATRAHRKRTHSSRKRYPNNSR